MCVRRAMQPPSTSSTIDQIKLTNLIYGPRGLAATRIINIGIFGDKHL